MAMRSVGDIRREFIRALWVVMNVYEAPAQNVDLLKSEANSPRFRRSDLDLATRFLSQHNEILSRPDRDPFRYLNHSFGYLELDITVLAGITKLTTGNHYGASTDFDFQLPTTNLGRSARPHPRHGFRFSHVKRDIESQARQ
jgi:hypothetical protein